MKIKSLQPTNKASSKGPKQISTNPNINNEWVQCARVPGEQVRCRHGGKGCVGMRERKGGDGWRCTGGKGRSRRGYLRRWRCGCRWRWENVAERMTVHFLIPLSLSVSLGLLMKIMITVMKITGQKENWSEIIKSIDYLLL